MFYKVISSVLILSVFKYFNENIDFIANNSVGEGSLVLSMIKGSFIRSTSHICSTIAHIDMTRVLDFQVGSKSRVSFGPLHNEIKCFIK